MFCEISIIYCVFSWYLIAYVRARTVSLWIIFKYFTILTSREIKYTIVRVKPIFLIAGWGLCRFFFHKTKGSADEIFWKPLVRRTASDVWHVWYTLYWMTARWRIPGPGRVLQLIKEKQNLMISREFVLRTLPPDNKRPRAANEETSAVIDSGKVCSREQRDLTLSARTYAAIIAHCFITRVKKKFFTPSIT